MALIDLANPTRFLTLSGRLLPWLGGATAIALAVGLTLAGAPDDYQQGATVKIMFIHVPSAWLAMAIWGTMSLAALGSLVWRHPLADVAAKAAAPVGAAFTLICLLTGSLWGRPMWGTYWVWDARLTSVLILFLMYLGIMALWRSVDDPISRRTRRRDPHPGRRDQPADHQVLGRLVEHAAPAGVGGAGCGPRNPSDHPGAAAGHGAGVPADVPDASPRRHAQRNPAAAGAHAHDDRSAGRAGAWTNLMASLGPHATFIVAAYGAAALILAALIGWIVLDHRAQQRALGELEKRGVTRRSGRPA